MSFDIVGDALTRYLGNDKEVVVPKEVKIIGERAFEATTNLESITIGENVNCIKSRAFSNCKSLVNVVFQGKIEKIEGLAFEKCTALREITLPEGLETLEFGIFEDCENLHKVTIPEGVKIINNSVFTGILACIPLEELILPDSVEYLGNSNISNGGYHKKPEDVLFKRIHFGKGLREIGSHSHNYYLFEDIEFVSDLNILFDKKYCGPEDTDPYSAKLYTDFTLDEENPYFKYEDGFLLSKDGKILYSCLIDNKDEIVVPDGVEKIMGHTFANVFCGKLVIPGSVNNMKGSFITSRIGKLVLSEGITEIQDQAFLLSHIKEIIFPNSLRKIEGCAFLDTYDLKTLRLYRNLEFHKYMTYYPFDGEGFKNQSPFWFSSDAGFNHLEFVELIDENGNTLSRLGMPSTKESRNVKEEYHFLLDEFLQNDGQSIASSIKRIYGKLKNKTSKLQLLYGALSNDTFNDPKTKKDLIPEIIKYKKTIHDMAAERDDEETAIRLKELLAENETRKQNKQ